MIAHLIDCIAAELPFIICFLPFVGCVLDGRRLHIFDGFFKKAGVARLLLPCGCLRFQPVKYSLFRRRALLTQPCQLRKRKPGQRGNIRFLTFKIDASLNYQLFCYFQPVKIIAGIVLFLFAHGFAPFFCWCDDVF